VNAIRKKIMTLNNITLVGRLARDPELRYTSQNQTPVCEISLAYNEGYGDNETSHFVDVVIWKKTAEVIAEHVKKGDEIAITGRLIQDRWEQDGQKRSKHKISANSFSFGQKSKKNEEAASQAPAQKPTPSPGDDDEPPF